MEPGKHQHLSTFWTSHIQRSARAELALRINKAHKEAERDKFLKLHRLQVSALQSLDDQHHLGRQVYACGGVRPFKAEASSRKPSKSSLPKSTTEIALTGQCEEGEDS
jgi:hypothetical protein